MSSGSTQIITTPPSLAVVAEKHFTTYRFIRKNSTNKGENNFGDINRTIIKGTTKSGRRQHLNLVEKSTTKNDAILKVIDFNAMFDNEIYFYNVILPAFDKFALRSSTGIRCLRNNAKLYNYCSERDNQSIILEDMNIYGFQLRDNTIPMDYAHCKLVMEQFGHIHAFSLAFKDQCPQQFQRIIEPLHEIVWHPNNGFGQVVQPCRRRGLACLRESKDVNVVERFAKFSENLLEAMVDLTDPHQAGDLAVINHGDGWSNNCLFQYTDGKPTDICMVDFQLVRYCTPVFDIAYFLYTNTERSLRDEYYDQLLNDYYSSVTRCIAELGSDPTRLFPKRRFHEHIQKFSGAGLAIALSCLLFFMSKGENSPKVGDIVTNPEAAEAWHQAAENNPEHQRKLRELIYEMAERNFI